MKKGNGLSLQKSNFKENISAVILCAGEGKRLNQITQTIPKPLIKIEILNNISILNHIINSLINLEINQIGIVIGYLGQTIREAILTLEKNNQALINKLIIIDTEDQYKFGPLYSFLSIIKNKNFFRSRNYYLVFPGDTIYDYNILKQVLSIISNNFSLIQHHPIIFYRNIGLKPLKELYNINRIISNIEITKLGSEIILKKINQLKVGDIHTKKVLNQVIPITALSYDSINEILNLNREKRNTIWETLNYMAFNGKKVLVFEIDNNYNFYDIDYENDLEKLKEKDNRCSDYSMYN